MDFSRLTQFRDNKLAPGIVWDKRGKKRVILQHLPGDRVEFIYFTDTEFEIRTVGNSAFYRYLNHRVGAELFATLPDCLLQLYIDVFGRKL